MSDTPTVLNTELCQPWATVEDCCCKLGKSNPTLYAQMLTLASYVLFIESGSVWPGTCEETVRPPHPGRGPGNIAPVWHGQPLTSGMGGLGGWYAWFPNDGGWCGAASIDDCHCQGPRMIELGGFPLVDVSEVKIDGVVLDPAEYNIVNDMLLQRLPEVGSTAPRHWPAWQRLDLEDTEPHTFSVTRTTGTPPPLLGKLAAASLACDLAAACSPGNCAIPERLEARLYEGGQYNFRTVDDKDHLDAGFTGNRLADLFIQTVNPEKIKSPPVVWSPDYGNRVDRIR